MISSFAISRAGRVLIADDMGLGKTVEALAVASYYKSEWPLIIVSPAGVRHTWLEVRSAPAPPRPNVPHCQLWWILQAIEKFFSPEYLPGDQVVSPDSARQAASQVRALTDQNVLVVSYDVLKSLDAESRRRSFKVVILVCSLTGDLPATRKCGRFCSGRVPSDQRLQIWPV